MLWLNHVSKNLRGSCNFHYVVISSDNLEAACDLCLELFDRSEIWPASRQHRCRRTCQTLKRCDSLNYQSRGIDNFRDLTKRILSAIETGFLTIRAWQRPNLVSMSLFQSRKAVCFTVRWDIETASAFSSASKPGRSNENPIWWQWHGNTKRLSNLLCCDA